MKRLLLLCCALAAPAAAQQQGAPTGSLIERNSGPVDTAETLGYAADSGQRMTVSVNVAGSGPYRFVVDTGAERTVISTELANSLGLRPSGDITLASVTQITRVPSVMIPQLEVGRRTLSGIQAPALAERHLGAQGMLGIDSLRSQRVVFDFARRELTLSTSVVDREEITPGEIVIRGRSRLGRMLITDANVDGQRVTVIIDTGSQVTIANEALRRRLERQERLGATARLALTDVTGDVVPVDYTRTSRLMIGALRIENLPIAFTEVQLFRTLGLSRRPAILLGMDALRLFDRVSIDFANRRVRLAPPISRLQAPVQVASLSSAP